MLLQPVHCKLEAGIGVDEAPRLVTLRLPRPFNVARDRALIQFGAKESRRFIFEYRLLERSFRFNSALTKLVTSPKLVALISLPKKGLKGVPLVKRVALRK